MPLPQVVTTAVTWIIYRAALLLSLVFDLSFPPRVSAELEVTILHFSVDYSFCYAVNLIRLQGLDNAKLFKENCPIRIHLSLHSPCWLCSALTVHEAVEVVHDVGGSGPLVHEAHPHNSLGDQSASVICGHQLDCGKGDPCHVGILGREK